VKVEFAKKHLEKGHKTVNEIIMKQATTTLMPLEKFLKKL
jgi:hypothetical protein